MNHYIINFLLYNKLYNNIGIIKMPKFLNEEGVKYLWSKISTELNSVFKVSDESLGSVDIDFGTPSYGSTEDATIDISCNVGDPLKSITINVTGRAGFQSYSLSGNQYVRWNSTFQLLVPSGGIWVVVYNGNFYITSGGGVFWEKSLTGDNRTSSSSLRDLNDSLDCYITRIL